MLRGVQVLRKIKSAFVLGAVLVGSSTPALATEAPPSPQVGEQYHVSYVTRSGKTVPYTPGGMRSAPGGAQPYAGPYTGATWAACGAFDNQNKVVRTFEAGRAPLAPVWFRKPQLTCGNSSYGYYHIRDKHSGDYGAIAARVGGDWRTFADFAMSQSLREPRTTCFGSNDTLNYVGWIEVRDSKGVLRGTYYPRVVVGNKSNNVVTSFPQKTSKC